MPSRRRNRWLGLGAQPGDEEVLSALKHRRRLEVLVALATIFWLAGVVANAFLPLLLRDHPLLLLILDARYRIVLVVSGKLGFAVIATVAFVRRMASRILYYLLGRWYGAAVLHWAERRSPRAGRLLVRGERAFARYGGLAVLASSGNTVCLLAGAAGMRPRDFGWLNLMGVLLQIAAAFLIAEVADTYVANAVGYADSNVSWLTALFFAATAAWLAWKVVRRRRSMRPAADAPDRNGDRSGG